MRWPAAFDRLAPDMSMTLRRFPLAVAMCVAVTVLALVVLNLQLEDSERLARLTVGIGTAAIFATAGVLARESGVGRGWALVAEWLLPVLVFVAWQFDLDAWYVPFGLPLIGALYLSVAPTLGVKNRENAQARFWWINHQAVTTGVVAVTAFLIVSLGLLAIERSLDLLFSVRLGDVFYRWLLPIAGLLLLPVYWLSTLPQLDSFNSDTLDHPDFLARAAGFLGQFVLAPLLGAYALILLAYTLQILVQWRLPVGILGWMVLSFVIGGAATYLLLWPPFMRRRVIARLFLNWWFWATLIPIALFGVAVGVRIAAYGFTPERIGLVAGGVWATGLALAFILKRGDIRLIPGLAALILLIVSVGPWSVQQGSIWSQSARLAAAMDRADATAGQAVAWTGTDAAEIRGALDYLLSSSGSDEARRILVQRGYDVPLDIPLSAQTAYRALGMPTDASVPDRTFAQLQRDRVRGVEVGSNALVLGQVLVNAEGLSPLGGVTLTVVKGVLRAELSGTPPSEVPLAPWVQSQQSQSVLTRPDLRFEVGDRRFLLAVDSLSVEHTTGTAAADGTVVWLQGTLLEMLP